MFFKLKIIVAQFLFLAAALIGKAQNQPKISLLTFDPGNESYSVFGHTAIRIQDEAKQTDWVYNFGIFDFDTPNFLAKFSTGVLDYKLGIQEYQPMLGNYFYEHRQVFEQQLNLNPTQTKTLVDKLQHLYRPENRYYRYRFLNRNCSTEVRDILFKGIDNVTYTTEPTNKTYRNYLDDYTRKTPWFKFGINLALGSTIDRNIDTYELMFLPDFLKEEIDKAQIKGQPLAKKPVATFKNLKPSNHEKWQLTPFILFAFLLVVMIFGKSKILIRTFIFSVGFMGLVVLTINLFSSHPEVHRNYNLLWLNPLYLVSLGLRFTKYKAFLKTLSTILILCLLTTLGIWFSKIQGYDIGFFPIIISLLWINLRQRQHAKVAD